MSITINLVNDLETQLRNAAKQEGVDPATYVANILERHLYKQTIAVSETEADLLQQINLDLSEETWQRYYQLRDKLQDETLLPDEQQTLVNITTQLEAANVRRIEALMKLAVLRNTTLDALMDELGLRPPAYVE